MNRALVVYLIVFLAACGKESREEAVVDVPGALQSGKLRVTVSGLTAPIMLANGNPLQGSGGIRFLKVEKDGEHEFANETAFGSPYAVFIFSGPVRGKCQLQDNIGVFPADRPVVVKCE